MAVKRPKRLWVICGLNILTAGASLFAVAFLVLNPAAAQELALDAQTVAVAVALATLLIVTSVLAFFRIRYSRWLVMLAALLFYGVLVVQQAWMLIEMAETVSEQQRLRTVASSTRSALEILLNVWALFSAKTSRYFADGAATRQLVSSVDNR